MRRGLRISRRGRASELIASQQAAAGDLRLVLSTFPIPSFFARMRRAAIRAATDRTTALQERDGARGLALEIADDVMDELHAQLFLQARAPTWRHGVGPAVEAALLGRCYERFADQALGIGRRIYFIRTGRDTADP